MPANSMNPTRNPFQQSAFTIREENINSSPHANPQPTSWEAVSEHSDRLGPDSKHLSDPPDAHNASRVNDGNAQAHPAVSMGENDGEEMSDEEDSMIEETPSVTIVKNYNPSMVVLMEPRISGVKADEFIKNSGFDHSHRVEAVGFSGGIWILWQSSIAVEGGVTQNSGVCGNFRQWFNGHQIFDLKFKGPRFTWSRGLLFKRLDKALCNSDWLIKFMANSVLHLPKVASDHRPMLVCFEKAASRHQGTRPFRFLAPWLTHEHFNSFVKKVWDPQAHYSAAASHFVQAIQEWNREVFGNIFQRKRRLMARINGIQAALEIYSSRGLVRLEARLQNELEMVMGQEEILWWQKSKKDELLHGDRSTNFFHQKTIVRRRRNRIEAIQDNSRNWIYSEEEIRNHAIGYFSSLYRSEAATPQRYQVPNLFPVLNAYDLESIADLVLDDKIKRVVFSMKPLKAPGTDGLHAIFYQSQWPVVGPSFFKLMADIFSSGKIPQELNTTLLILIPKVEHPTSLSMFRPISLCTVAYKTVTKIIANRLQALLPELIGPHQTSFVPGRHIIDNIVVAQDVVHSIRNKIGKRGFMAIKLSRLVMECITSARMSILWNGEATSEFVPGRGIRQGDPLSPYIFVLCIERLSHGITQAMRDEASIDQAYTIDTVLENYCRSSEAKVNKSKTKFFFSKNVVSREAQLLNDVLGYSATNDLGCYLGMPLLHSRVNKATYQTILDKVDKRLTGWNAAHLSFAGRITLAHSVLQAIPIYAMQTTLLLAPVRGKIEKSCRRHLPLSLHEKQGSRIWKAIKSTWSATMLGARWAVCDGARIHFWLDCWAIKQGPLINLAVHPVPQELVNATVSEFINVHGGWNWSAFEHLLPNSILLQIASLGLTTTDTAWNLAWSWKGPQTVRIFLWQVLHAKLKTKGELSRRHIPVSMGVDKIY
ncbi:reverse transcriptase domain-containing protein [Citrus sinensis]|uniref:Reverse transcriptase domain-containing protein n=1 Tax=Citrus sinensis TaxID=2711 RepID=A0ACB8IJA5_CITSI|nr:reverse transcriptase domain-containing protein [Citrus sinensis]